jgi:hypothetical protein
MTPAKFLNELQFAGDTCFVGKQLRNPTAATNKVGQSLQCGFRITKAAHELAITDRTNIG